MEMKDLIGLILTVIAVIFFRSVSSAGKKKPANMARKNPPVVPISESKMGKKSSPKKTDVSVKCTTRRPQVGPVIREESKNHLNSKSKLFSDKGSLKKGFIMQEVLKRPYE